MERATGAFLFVSEDLLSGLVIDGAAARAASVDAVAGGGAGVTAAADGIVTADAGPVANSMVETVGEPDVESGVAAGALFAVIGDTGAAAGAGPVNVFVGF